VRLGQLPVVVIPSEIQEAARDLVRAREDVRGDLMRARHRLSKLLLRQGFLFEGTSWTGAHEKWLQSLSFDKPGVQFAFDEAVDTV
jgi:transposase